MQRWRRLILIDGRHDGLEIGRAGAALAAVVCMWGGAVAVGGPAVGRSGAGVGSEIPWVGDFSRPVRVAAAVDVERGRAAGPRRSYWLGELTATGNVAVGQWSAWASAAGTSGLYGP